MFLCTLHLLPLVTGPQVHWVPSRDPAWRSGPLCSQAPPVSARAPAWRSGPLRSKALHVSARAPIGHFLGFACPSRNSNFWLVLPLWRPNLRIRTPPIYVIELIAPGLGWHRYFLFPRDCTSLLAPAWLRLLVVIVLVGLESPSFPPFCPGLDLLPDLGGLLKD